MLTGTEGGHLLNTDLMRTRESILIRSPDRWGCRVTQLESGGAQI